MMAEFQFLNELFIYIWEEQTSSTSFSSKTWITCPGRLAQWGHLIHVFRISTYTARQEFQIQAQESAKTLPSVHLMFKEIMQ